jgi:S1-C subfamily serine protease
MILAIGYRAELVTSSGGLSSGLITALTGNDAGGWNGRRMIQTEAHISQHCSVRTMLNLDAESHRFG